MHEGPRGNAHGERVRLGDRWITPDANEIDGAHVDPKAMDVLIELISAAPAVVSGHALLERVWPGLVVVPNVLQQTITQLRKALGDDARAPRYIQTIPRRGYRLIADVVRASSIGAHRGNAATARQSHNLPAELTSFVGRTADITGVVQLLRSQRLVTLTGVGGCGKTRLALAAAGALLGDFVDGVWLVELAPAVEPAQVEHRVASALGMQALHGLSLRESLLVTLADQQRLVLLDNCEHLIEACAQLAEALLRKAPALRILATSREPLGVAGEHPWHVQPLAVPDASQKASIGSLADIDSVRLFVERARVQAPEFVVTSANAWAVARVCQRLDGIPLALELAAARVRTLSIESIATRVAADFHLLTGGGRAAPPHQRTMQASLDWSSQLLPPRARVLLRRLSTFAGGFTLTAAEAVAGGDPLEPEDVVDLLSCLVEQSMVEISSTFAIGQRYRLLEPVRQYAREQLEDSGESDAILDLHRDCFVVRCIQMMDECNSGAGIGIYPLFEAESANFEKASMRCLETDAARGLRLMLSFCKVVETAAPSSYAWRRGRLQLQDFLARTPATAPWRAWALSQVTSLPVVDLPLLRRRDLLEEAIALLATDAGLSAHAHRTLHLACLTKLGMTLIELGEHEAGARRVESTLAAARESGDAHALGMCLMNVSWQGSETAEERAGECVDAFRQSGNHVWLARALRRRCETGLVGESFGQVVPAWADELLELARAQGNLDLTARAMVFVAILMEQRGARLQATELLRRSVELAPTAVSRNRYEHARALCQMGELARAETLLREQLGDIREPARPPELSREDRPARSPYSTSMVQWLFAAQPTLAQERDRARALCLLGLALISGARGQYVKAAWLYGASIGLRDRLHFGILATEKSLHDGIVPKIATALGMDTWNSLRAEGGQMTEQRITALATMDVPLHPS